MSKEPTTIEELIAYQKRTKGTLNALSRRHIAQQIANIQERNAESQPLKAACFVIIAGGYMITEAMKVVEKSGFAKMKLGQTTSTFNNHFYDFCERNRILDEHPIPAHIRNVALVFGRMISQCEDISQITEVVTTIDAVSKKEYEFDEGNERIGQADRHMQLGELVNLMIQDKRNPGLGLIDQFFKNNGIEPDKDYKKPATYWKHRILGGEILK